MPVLAQNKRAYFDYQVLETYEAGIILSGPEVKSVKSGQIDLQGSYIVIDKDQRLWLINARISPYPPARSIQQNYNPLQNRKLLLHKKEISSLVGKFQQRGLTILPLKVYTNHRLIKVEIGICQGKKKYEKREIIKKRDIDKQIKEVMRGKI